MGIQGLKVTKEQKELFFAALEKYPSVISACRAANFDKTTAYDFRRDDPEFAAQWAEALENGLDALRGVAHTVATGVIKPVISMGKVVMLPADGDQPSKMLMETVVDSAMTRFLLQAHDATYRPAPAVAAPQAVPADLLPDPVPTPDEAGPVNPIL